MAGGEVWCLNVIACIQCWDGCCDNLWRSHSQGGGQDKSGFEKKARRQMFTGTMRTQGSDQHGGTPQLPARANSAGDSTLALKEEY